MLNNVTLAIYICHITNAALYLRRALKLPSAELLPQKKRLTM